MGKFYIEDVTAMLLIAALSLVACWITKTAEPLTLGVTGISALAGRGKNNVTTP